MKTVNALLIDLCLIYFSICFDLQLGKPGQPIERFDGSCGLRNLPIVAHYYNLEIEGTKAHVNVSLVVKQDIDNDPILILKIKKCKNADNLDTCEELPDIQEKNVCSFFKPSNSIWGSLFAVMDPPIRCPLKQNVHRSDKSVVDMKMFFMVPPQQQYWKLKVELKHNETRKELLCAIMEFHVSMKW